MGQISSHETFKDPRSSSAVADAVFLQTDVTGHFQHGVFSCGAQLSPVCYLIRTEKLGRSQYSRPANSPQKYSIFNKTALKVCCLLALQPSTLCASVHIFTVTDCPCVHLMLNATLTWRLKHLFTWIQSIEMENSHFHASLWQTSCECHQKCIKGRPWRRGMRIPAI